MKWRGIRDGFEKDGQVKSPWERLISRMGIFVVLKGNGCSTGCIARPATAAGYSTTTTAASGAKKTITLKNVEITFVIVPFGGEWSTHF